MSSQAVFAAFDYSIDRQDVLVGLSDAWLAFARQNQAPELVEETVLGHSLWEYVSGESTRELYDAVFRRVRSEGEPVKIPFRCDSPERFRFVELVVAPAARSGIDLQGRLLREQQRPYLSIMDRLATHTLPELPMCSVCLRLQIVEGQWVEAEEAIERLGLFDTPTTPGLEYTVCQRCRDQVRAGGVAGSSGDIPAAC